jgi:hypothetical protein
VQGKQLENVEVHETDTQIIILGDPPTEGLDDDEAIAIHNCDHMGCGTHHVIFRFNKDSDAQLAKAFSAGQDHMYQQVLSVISGEITYLNQIDTPTFPERRIRVALENLVTKIKALISPERG